MKYFVLGALSSGLLLYGMSMIYGATGTLDIYRGGAARLRASPAAPPTARFLVFGLVFVVAGIAFKLGVVPFHMWIPDVYHGAPTPVTLVHRLGAQARRLRHGDAPAGERPARRWRTTGSRCWRCSRCCRWRSATSPPSRRPTSSACSPTRPSRTWASCCSACCRAWSAATALNARRRLQRGAVLRHRLRPHVARRLRHAAVPVARRASSARTSTTSRASTARTPWYAFLMMVLMFSLAGLPPTAGFYAKLAVLQAAVDGRAGLAGGGRGGAVAGRRVLLPAHRQADVLRRAEGRRAARRAAPAAASLLSANGLALLLFGILPQPLMALVPGGDPGALKKDLTEHFVAGRDRSTTASCSRCTATACACPTAARARASTSAIPARWRSCALFDDGRVLLERQFRYPHRREFIEIPAGKLEPASRTSTPRKRELLEETGYDAGRVDAPRRDPHRDRLHRRGDRALRRAQADARASASSTPGEFLEMLQRAVRRGDRHDPRRPHHRRQDRHRAAAGGEVAGR